MPDQNVILMENYVNPTTKVPGVDREQQIWTYRYGEAKPPASPPPPDGVKVTTTARSANITWNASPDGSVRGYTILRGEGAAPWQVELKSIAITPVAKVTSFEDMQVKPGQIYHYAVRATTNAGKSADSVKVRTQPRIVEDVTVSVVGPKEVNLTWTPPRGDDIAGYDIERAAVEVFSDDEIVRLKKDTPPLESPSVGTVRAIGPFVKLSKTLKPSFTDTTVDLTKPATIDGQPIWKHGFRAEQLDETGKAYRHGVYAYRVRAVNHLGVAGGPSPYFLTIPSSPKWVFAKEAGNDCQLKWQANPEQGLKGYRVYRMESPRINGPGQKVTRVTAEPLTAMTFTDAKIGPDTRRYWIVAVDALGQEGTPSAPVWHYRQYRKHYEPFVGEWHQ